MVSHNLPPTWEFITIDDVAYTSSGGTPSRNNKKNFGGKIPWIKSGELNNSSIFSSEETILKMVLKPQAQRYYLKTLY